MHLGKVKALGHPGVRKPGARGSGQLSSNVTGLVSPRVAYGPLLEQSSAEPGLGGAALQATKPLHVHFSLGLWNWQGLSSLDHTDEGTVAHRGLVTCLRSRK